MKYGGQRSYKSITTYSYLIMPPRMKPEVLVGLLSNHKEGERVGRGSSGRGTRRGNVGSQNGNVVNENIQENVRNVLVNSSLVGCSYKEFLACNPKEYDGNALTWWNSQIRTLSQEVAISLSWNDFKFMIIKDFFPSHEMQKLETKLMVAATEPKSMQKAMEISGSLTDEAVRNGINYKWPWKPRNQARGRAFMLGAEEARQDPNIVTGLA
ncbi:hypothetical protein Tco_1553822 [Tanacetum coccineum]